MTPEEAFALGEKYMETVKRLKAADDALQEIVTGLSIIDSVPGQALAEVRAKLFNIALVGLASARGFKLQAVGTLPSEPQKG